MKLFGREFQGAAKALVILVAAFLVASGVCGLEIAVASQLKGDSASALIPFGILDLIVLVGSGLGIIGMLLFMLVRAIVRASADPVKEDAATVRGDGEDSKK